MSSTDAQGPTNYRHSLLDRLLGLSDGVERARTPGKVKSRREERIRRQIEDDPNAGRRDSPMLDWIIAAVKEDLRCLLNATRPLVHEGAEPDDPLYQSLWTYGIADLSDRSPIDVVANNLLAQAVGDAIARFEPRLSDVDVSVGDGDPSEPSIRLRITARLHVDRVGGQAVALDTLMWLGSRKIDVTGGFDGGEARPPLSP